MLSPPPSSADALLTLRSFVRSVVVVVVVFFGVFYDNFFQAITQANKHARSFVCLCGHRRGSTGRQQSADALFVARDNVPSAVAWGSRGLVTETVISGCYVN
jgi:hypothetical protein